jgi:hypothetical protein
MRRVAKKDLPLEVLLATILDAGASVLSAAAVGLTRLCRREKKGLTAICPGCGEAHGAGQGVICKACRGDGYYDLIPQGRRSVACR